MKFRYARHSNNIQKLVQFYTELLELEILGYFKDHEGYDGVFLGLSSRDWHLEFTQSNEPAQHDPDPDDLLVFYLNSQEELKRILEKAKQMNLEQYSPKNPYWKENGTLFLDPDGFGIVLSLDLPS